LTAAGGLASPSRVDREQLSPRAAAVARRGDVDEERKQSPPPAARPAMRAALKGSVRLQSPNASDAVHSSSKSKSKSDKHVSFSDDIAAGGVGGGGSDDDAAEEEEEKKSSLPPPSLLSSLRANADPSVWAAAAAEGADPACAENLAAALEFKCAKACSSWLRHRQTHLRRKGVIPWEPTIAAGMMREIVPLEWAAATLTAPQLLGPSSSAAEKDKLATDDHELATAEQEAAAARLVNIYSSGIGGSSDEVQLIEMNSPVRHAHPLQPLQPLGMAAPSSSSLPSPSASTRPTGNAGAVRMHVYSTNDEIADLDERRTGGPLHQPLTGRSGGGGGTTMHDSVFD